MLKWPQLRAKQRASISSQSSNDNGTTVSSCALKKPSMNDKPNQPSSQQQMTPRNPDLDEIMNNYNPNSITSLFIAKNHYFIKSLKEEVVCSICLEEFEHPRLLKCGHSFCTSCLKSIYVTGCALRCPTCRDATVFDQKLIEEHLPSTNKSSRENSSSNAGISANSSSSRQQQPRRKAKKYQLPISIIETLPINYAICNVMEALKWNMQSQSTRKSIESVYPSYVSIATESDSLSASSQNQSSDQTLLLCDHHNCEEVQFWCQECQVMLCPQCLVSGSPRASFSSVQSGECLDNAAESSTAAQKRKVNDKVSHRKHTLVTMSQASLDLTKELFKFYRLCQLQMDDAKVMLENIPVLDEKIDQILNETKLMDTMDVPEMSEKVMLSLSPVAQNIRILDIQRANWINHGIKHFNQKIQKLKHQVPKDKELVIKINDEGKKLISRGQDTAKNLASILEQVGVILNEQDINEHLHLEELLAETEIDDDSNNFESSASLYHFRLKREPRSRDRAVIWKDGKALLQELTVWKNQLSHWTSNVEQFINSRCQQCFEINDKLHDAKIEESIETQIYDSLNKIDLTLN